MSRLQTDPERTCPVAKDYQAEFPDPIAVEAGEAFTVSERTSAWENNPAWIWVWCTDQQGKSGWVPKNIIQMDADGQTGTRGFLHIPPKRCTRFGGICKNPHSRILARLLSGLREAFPFFTDYRTFCRLYVIRTCFKCRERAEMV